MKKILVSALISLFAAVGIATEFNVRNFGAAGDGKTDDLEAFRKAAGALRKAEPGSTLTIPKGRYRLSRALALDHLPPGSVIIGETGTELWFDDLLRGGIEIAETRKLTLKNLQIGFSPVSCLSGKVTARPDRKSLVVAIPGLDRFGQPELRTMLHIFTPEGKMDHRFHRTDVCKVEPAGEGLFRITFDHPINDDAVAGQTAVLFLRGGRPAVNNNRSSDGIYENLHVVNGGDLAFGLRYCDGMTFRNCRIGSLDPAARPISTGADGIHSKHARRGPVIENCDFSGMSDDDVNLSTTFQNVASTDGNTALLVGDNRDYRPGDRVALYDPETSSTTQHLTVAAAEPAKWRNRDAVKVTFDQPLNAAETLDSLKLENPYALLFGHKGKLPALVFNRETVHAGTVIRNNRFGNNRARGLLLRTPDTLIEGNTFYNLRGPAILMASEGMWMECGRIENVTIRDNRFEEISRSPVLFSTISYRSRREPGERWNRNLTVTGNTFTGCGAPAVEGGDTFGLFGNLILLENVSGAVVSGNTFGPRSPLAPKRDAVLVSNSENVNVSNNREQ